MKTGTIRGAGGDIALSKIVLGTCYYGTDIPKEESFRLLDRYYEAGGRTVDTARVYACWLPDGLSASEKTIGEWLRSTGVRPEITLVTKGGHPPMDNMRRPRLSPGELRQDIELSLSCLGTDYVDVYFLHRDDETIPVGEIMDTLHEFVTEGKARSLGASNWSLKRILEANDYASRNGKTPFAVSQIQWSLASCTPESWGDETLVCMDDEEYRGYLGAGIPVMAFSSQAKGFFSKYIAEGPDGLNAKIVSRFVNETNLKRLERVRRLCEETGASPAAVAMAYITCNRLSGFAIAGCSNAGQLEDTLTAAELTLSGDTLDWLAGSYFPL